MGLNDVPLPANAVTTSASGWNTAEKFPQVTFLGVNPEVFSPPPSQNYGGLIGALRMMGGGGRFKVAKTPGAAQIVPFQSAGLF